MIVVCSATRERSSWWLFHIGKQEFIERIDVIEKKMAEVEVKGRVVLFTELRVGKETIPEGMYCYVMRHGDDGRMPCTIE